MTTIVKRFVGQNSYAVSATNGSTPLPAGLVIPPGNYVFQGACRNCMSEGYYDFWDPNAAVTARRIVYNGDVATLMSSFAHSTAVGSQDSGTTNTSLLNQAKTSKPRLMCGNTALWVKGMCDSIVNIGLPAVTSRIAKALTAQTPTNYFDGHVMIEATVSGAWQLFDIAMGTSFGGLALKDALPLQAPVTRWVQKDVSVAPVAPGAFDANSWINNTMPTDAEFGSEMMRVLQVPAIVDADGKTRCYLPDGMEGAAQYVTAEGFTIQPQADWLAQHYS